MRGSILIAVGLGLLLALVFWGMHPQEMKRPAISQRPASSASEGNPVTTPSPAIAPAQANAPPKPTDDPLPEKMRESIEQRWKGHDWVLNGLGLTPPTLVRLKALLVERDLSANDAHDLAPLMQVRGIDQIKAVADARAQVDLEIADILDPATGRFVKEMLSLEQSGEFTTVVYNYRPEFSSAGAPLSGQQALALAEILHRVNLPVTGSIKDQWVAKIQSVDPATGLSAANREAILEATTVLGPIQIEILKTHLVRDTQRISEYIRDRWPADPGPSRN